MRSFILSLVLGGTALGLLAALPAEGTAQRRQTMAAPPSPSLASLQFRLMIVPGTRPPLAIVPTNSLRSLHLPGARLSGAFRLPAARPRSLAVSQMPQMPYTGSSSYSIPPIPMMPYSGAGAYSMPYGGNSAYPQMYGSDESDGSSLAGPIVSVNIYDNYFEESTINIPAGTTVQWTNYGWHAHTVTSESSLLNSGKLLPGNSYRYTFAQPGTYSYYCAIHRNMMQAVVVVK